MTVDKVLEIARSQIGIKENPPNSNKVLYNDWYYGRSVSGSAYPWCVTFVDWVFNQANVEMPIKTASCTALMNAAKKCGQWITKDFRSGDMLIFSFNKNKTPEHCGIAEAVGAVSIVSIEGNTSINGSQSNGGEVCRRTRNNNVIVGAYRPKYKEEKKMDNTPSPAHKDGVEWAVKNKILTGDKNGNLMLTEPLTRQQFCTMLHRFYENCFE